MPHDTRTSRSRTRPLHRTAPRPTARLDGCRAPLHATETSPGLRVELSRDAGRPRLRVAGELDLTSAALLAAMLDHARRAAHVRTQLDPQELEVDVDLARVTFADSHGLGPVLDSRTRVVAASTQVRRVLDVLEDLPHPRTSRPAPELGRTCP